MVSGQTADMSLLSLQLCDGDRLIIIEGEIYKADLRKADYAYVFTISMEIMLPVQ